MARRNEIIYTKPLVVVTPITGETMTVTKDLDMSDPIRDRDYIERTVINEAKAIVDSQRYNRLF